MESSQASPLSKAPEGSNQIRIVGGNCLEGAIRISGSKNAALPLMCACLLTDAPVRLSNVPVSLSDVTALAEVLRRLGVDVEIAGESSAILHSLKVTSHKVHRELAKRLRSSVLVLGPLLARHGKAEVAFPGGCPIGVRPVDFHLNGLESMGATIELGDGLIRASAMNGLKGAVVNFPRVSVGATENIMMAACLADGTTTMTNAAKEPQIVNLGEMLINMGASIEGLGTGRITVQGKAKLCGAAHAVIPDDVETATWMIACCLTGGTLHLQNTTLDHLESVVKPLQTAGLDIQDSGTVVTVHRSAGRMLSGSSITTEPHPGFPTDAQAPFMVLLTLCEGTNTVTETQFENRFLHVPELCKMGARIRVSGNSALVTGVSRLGGRNVSAADLRGGAALVLAALVADGETSIDGVHHIDRGYENIVKKLRGCGARIERIEDTM